MGIVKRKSLREKVRCEQPPMPFRHLDNQPIFHILRPTICKQLISNLFDIVGDIYFFFYERS